MHSDQMQTTWSVDFDEFSATLCKGMNFIFFYLNFLKVWQYLSLPTIAPTTTSRRTRLTPAPETKPFFEAHMRNTQNEVVTPVEVIIKSDDWNPYLYSAPGLDASFEGDISIDVSTALFLTLICEFN